MHGFADAIRVQGCTLGQCTRNLSGWQHHWTIWQGAPTKETKTKGDGSGNSTINDDVATELKKVQSPARSCRANMIETRTSWTGCSVGVSTATRFTSLSWYTYVSVTILKDTFVLVIYVLKNGKMLVTIPMRTLLPCLQDCDNECNPQDCDFNDFDLSKFDETTHGALAQQRSQFLPIRHGLSHGTLLLIQSGQLRFRCLGIICWMCDPHNLIRTARMDVCAAH